MTPPTRQLLDPAGTLAIYPTTISLAALAFVGSVIPTISSLVRGEGNALLLILALTVFCTCCLAVIVAANPYRAPFTVRGHFIVHLLALATFILSSWATWGADTTFVRGNWAALALGVLLIAVSPYRPVSELIGAGSITALFFALVAFAKAEEASIQAPPLAVAAGAALAVLAFCYGNAAYSARTIAALGRSRAQADVASDALTTEVNDGVLRLVREDRATILERDVRPFFAEIVGSTTITADQKERARQISDSIRRTMVADADRTWLGALFAHSDSALLNRASIDDPATAAPAMSMIQRTSLRALLVALGTDGGAEQLSVAISVAGSTCTGRLSALVHSSERELRARYGPYLAVIRVAFEGSTTVFDQQTLTVRFTYDRA